MELTFNKVDNWYEAEFEIADDINLHIELNVAAPIKLYQKTAGDKYDLVQAFKPSMDKVLDTDLMALVYPKYIKVVSQAEVTRAVVLPEGVAKPVVAFRTEYDANIYEDRKALYENLKALLPASIYDDTRVILPTPITVHCPWDWSAIVEAIDWPGSDTINMWQWLDDGPGYYNYVLSVGPERNDYNVYISD